MADEQPKIIVDSDWKSQAQKEKQKLAEQEQQAAAQGGQAGGKGAGGGGGREMPEPNFQSLVGTLVTQALMYMGAFPDPQTGKAMVSPEYARFHIDLLATLEEKTKGNITDEEASDLSRAVNELRMQYAEVVKAVAEMMAQQKGQENQGPGMVGGSDPMAGS